MSIEENLRLVAGQKVKEKNFVNHYMTFRQQRSDKVTDPVFHSVAGQLLSIALRKRLKSGVTLESFIETCKQKFSERINDLEFESLLDEMYFQNGAKGLFQVSPEFLLFMAGVPSSGNTKNISQIMAGLLTSSNLVSEAKSGDVNFLEAELVAELQENLSTHEPENSGFPYLPFMATVFTEDFSFLCRYPDYFLQNIKAFVGLYNFLYSAQLAMNINEWKSEPRSKPLYFILDTEKASIERKQVKDSFPWLKGRVADLFPVISVLEYLNQPDSKTARRYPLWQHFNFLQQLGADKQAEVVSGLAGFVASYRASRDLEPINFSPKTPESVVGAIIKSAKEVFNKPRSSQLTVNNRVVSAFENEVARHFIQNRKRGGLVLILNQDYLLLLTNLAIGSKDRMQFQQLLAAFEARGIWFDQQSRQALIGFYERVGNAERMSDSGDAVYVRKTI